MRNIGLIIVFISLSLILYLNINVYSSMYKNKEVANIFNIFFQNKTLNINNNNQNNFPILEINNTDYIGIINIKGLSIPIESKCTNKYNCNYSTSPFIILGTNLKNSFSNYKLYTVNDSLEFINSLGDVYKYKINSIKRIDKLKFIEEYNEDLIIIIKDYYNLEYVLLICEYS